MTPESIAAEANSLRENDAFQKALDGIKSQALDALVAINADDKNGIVRLQATVGVVDDIRSDLEQFIRSGAPKKPAGIA